MENVVLEVAHAGEWGNGRYEWSGTCRWQIVLRRSSLLPFGPSSSLYAPQAGGLFGFELVREFVRSGCLAVGGGGWGRGGVLVGLLRREREGGRLMGRFGAWCLGPRF